MREGCEASVAPSIGQCGQLGPALAVGAGYALPVAWRVGDLLGFS